MTNHIDDRVTSKFERLARLLGLVTGACRAAVGFEPCCESAPVAAPAKVGPRRPSGDVRRATPMGVMRARAFVAEGRKFESREAVRAELKRRGLSAPQMAVAMEVSPSIVYAVLYDRHKGLRGQAHRAAVMLGLKDGVVE